MMEHANHPQTMGRGSVQASRTPTSLLRACLSRKTPVTSTNLWTCHGHAPNSPYTCNIQKLLNMYKHGTLGTRDILEFTPPSCCTAVALLSERVALVPQKDEVMREENLYGMVHRLDVGTTGSLLVARRFRFRSRLGMFGCLRKGWVVTPEWRCSGRGEAKDVEEQD